MTTYDEQQSEFGRRVQWLVEIELDRCTLTYTQGACTVSDLGDGNRCRYSWTTCQLPTAYTKGTRMLRFCLADVPWPDNSVQVYPLLKKFVGAPQKVDPAKLYVYPEKVTLDFFYDWEPPALDHDKGGTPPNEYFNTERGGEFWAKIIAANRNYVGRPLRMKRGFYADGFTMSEFRQVGPDFKLKEITRNESGIRIIAESALADLKDEMAPRPISEDNVITSAGGVTSGATSWTVLDGSEFPDPDDFPNSKVYVQADSEIVEVESITGNTLTVVRGRLDTVAASHVEATVVKHVLFIGQENDYDSPTAINVMDALQQLLEWAGVASGDVDSASFDVVKVTAWSSEVIRRLVVKPQKISKLVHELRESRGILLFINADGKFAASVIAPGVPTKTITDESIVEGSLDVIESEEERLTRATIFYDPNTEAPGTNAADYDKALVVVDGEVESDNFYGDKKTRAVTDPWIDPNTQVVLVRSHTLRLVSRFRHGLRTFRFDLELIDGDLFVGDLILISTDMVVNPSGESEIRPAVVTVRRERTENVFTYEAVDTNYNGPYLRIGPDTMTRLFDNASEDDKQYGYWSDATDARIGSAKALGYKFW